MRILIGHGRASVGQCLVRVGTLHRGEVGTEQKGNPSTARHARCPPFDGARARPAPPRRQPPAAAGVLGGGMRTAGVRCDLGAWRRHRVVARQHRVPHPVRELRCIGGRVDHRGRNSVRVGVSCPADQHAFACQRRGPARSRRRHRRRAIPAATPETPGCRPWGKGATGAPRHRGRGRDRHSGGGQTRRLQQFRAHGAQRMGAFGRVLQRVRVASKPPKSWMVAGRSDSATCGWRVIQCGDTTSTACGRGNRRPSVARFAPARQGRARRWARRARRTG